MRGTIPWIAILAAATLAASGCGENQGAQTRAASAPSGRGGNREKEIATAVFAGGCFWCVESAFDDLPGVVEAISGFTGGKEANPTYEDVSAGATGHREAVQVRYDPAKIGYADLLEVFWRQIDPTDPDGQFADRGDQYRAAIFVQDESQRRQAEASKDRLVKSGWFDKPIVTPILPAGPFYPAEAYHQDYHHNHPVQYKAYRWGSGRGPFLEKFWKDKPAAKPVSENPKKDDLRSRLTPLQYRVTQEEGTEPAFQNEYWNHHEPGIYVDVVTGEALFSSVDKFDSGTGWPSFVRPLEPKNVVEKSDRFLGMAGIEVRSREGDSHLGHLFPDGPPPTGMRYCINSAALRFVPADKLEVEGYGKYAGAFRKNGKRNAKGS